MHLRYYFNYFFNTDFFYKIVVDYQITHNLITNLLNIKLAKISALFAKIYNLLQKQ